MPRARVRAHLYTDGGGWGLPTIDADGLAAHALLRFGGIEYVSVSGAPRSLTTSQQLPVVIFEGANAGPSSSEPAMAAGLGSLIGQLTANRALPDPNAHLTPFMAAESTAFATLVTSRLDPARLYELFADDANYADVFRALSPASSSWPLNRVVPFLRRREICQSLAGKDADALLFDAGIVVAALSTRLGDRSRYFYGDKPSVLDAIVFGQLAVALLVPLPRPRLRALVAGYPNLIQFVERIRMEFFKDDSKYWSGRMDNEEAAELCRAEAERRAEEESSRRAAEQRAREARDGAPPPSSETPEESERKRGNLYFIWASVAVFAAHMLLSNEIEFSLH